MVIMGDMRKGCVVGILVLGIVAITAVLGWILFPRVVAALPAQVRLYLPEEVIRAASTPLPTALPAPAFTPQSVALIPTLALPTSTPSPTPTIPATYTAVFPHTETQIPTSEAPTPITDNRLPITGRRDQSGEQRQHIRIIVDQHFGVPLYADGVGVSGHFNGFNESIGGSGHGR